MAVSGFWRSKVSSSLLYMRAPAEVQSIGGTQSLQDKIRPGHGVLLGDFNEANGCGEVTWIGAVEGVDTDSKTLRVNWRSADITLKPTVSGASYWRTFWLSRWLRSRHRKARLTERHCSPLPGPAHTQRFQKDAPRRCARTWRPPRASSPRASGRTHRDCWSAGVTCSCRSP